MTSSGTAGAAGPARKANHRDPADDGAGRRRIAILPDAVADQIAAGEVVERPASVVKELVENAVDAGATRIRVAIEHGGKTRVEVSDDGCGMVREDAVLALDRHATSKIRQTKDLVGVATFGFRGEALPSIASVSRLRLSTSPGDEDGTELRVTGGRLDKVETVARQRGTTVEVRGLFFNTPARRKFLRSASAETRSAHNALATLALAHPEAGFDFAADGRNRLSVAPGQSLIDRVSQVWGRELADTLIPVEGAAGAFRVHGLIQRPGDASPTGRRVQLLVNGRPFRDNFLVRAAEAGYRSAIHPGDRPSMLLHVEVDPDQVDVNVHPAKLEVRFRDRIGLERVVEDVVRRALGDEEAAVSLSSWRPEPAGQEVPADLFAMEPARVAEEELPGSAVEGKQPELSAAPELPPLLQLFDTYITYQGPDGVVMVDQHAAHERVIFERVMADLTGDQVAAQRLLIPMTVDLTDEELDVLDGFGDEIARVGFEVERFGGRTVKLTSVPNPHPRFDSMTCFRELVADLARGRFGGWANRLERFAATFACRAAVKAGQKLDQSEMRRLLADLFSTRLPPHDVHGRATMVKLPRDELERRFGRR